MPKDLNNTVMDENRIVEWKFFEEEIMSLRGVMVPEDERNIHTHIYIYYSIVTRY